MWVVYKGIGLLQHTDHSDKQRELQLQEFTKGKNMLDFVTVNNCSSLKLLPMNHKGNCYSLERKYIGRVAHCINRNCSTSRDFVSKPKQRATSTHENPDRSV